MLEYQQNKFSLEFLSSLKSLNLHHIRSADFWLMSADLIWCKLGDFKEDKNSRLNIFCYYSRKSWSWIWQKCFVRKDFNSVWNLWTNSLCLSELYSRSTIKTQMNLLFLLLLVQLGPKALKSLQKYPTFEGVFFKIS